MTMKQICFNIDDEVDQEFREVVFKIKGLRRGSIVDALHEAVKLWIIVNKNNKSSDLEKILANLDKIKEKPLKPRSTAKNKSL